MANILITGATGNIGSAIIRSFDYSSKHQLIAGIRENENAGLPTQVRSVSFDFVNVSGFSTALHNIDVVFLLRPPQLADIAQIFAPFVEAAVNNRIKHLVFLSVQGADTMSYIPHSKIEKLIIDSGIPYTFIRPGYFMQNLITTLKADLVGKKQIYLPAGETLFNWTDADDVGLVCAQILSHYQDHKHKVYTITGTEQHSFTTVAKMISSVCGINITYKSPGPLAFLVNRKKAGDNLNYILVMLLLHYVPRFGKQPELTSTYKELTGREPKTLQQFIAAEVQPYFT